MASAFLLTTGILGILAAPALSQAPPSASPAKTVSRTTKAVNYRRAGAAKIDFQGTELMQQAGGEARVQNKGSRTEIEAKFTGLDEATKFGLEYLTYVLWAVSPGGRAVNLGEVVLKNGSGEVKAISDMQTFGMIVTAEPYFSVTQPGNTVVLENVFGPATLGKVENIDASYELLGRGIYSSSNTKIENAIFGIDRKTPLELFEARNSLRIAHIALADKYAASTLAKAEQQLKNAEDIYARKSDKKSVIAAAREAVETAEESRVMAVKQKAEEDAQARVAAEKRAAEDRAARARADADAEVKRRQEADQARAQAEQARTQAEQARAQAEAEAQARAAEQAKTAALSKELSDLKAQQTDRGIVLTVGDVLFATGKAEVAPGGQRSVDKLAEFLKKNPKRNVLIEGHTDNTGNEDFNLKLSQQRADAVRDLLVARGIATERITTKGYGPKYPLVVNDTPSGRQQNRRVEVVVLNEGVSAESAAR